MAHAAAGADPDLAALDREGERRRLAGQRATVHDWRRRGTLRADLSTAQAADVLWAMTSPAVYRLFVIEGQRPAATSVHRLDRRATERRELINRRRLAL